MRVLSALIVLAALSGCATFKPKPESEWVDWEDIRVGGAPASVRRIIGEPSKIAQANGQEFWFYERCAVRFKDEKIAGKSCINDGPDWSKIGEGTSLVELAYYVGLSNNFETTQHGKTYFYQVDDFTRCAVSVTQTSEKIGIITGRRCEVDQAARFQAMQLRQQQWNALQQRHQAEDERRQRQYESQLRQFQDRSISTECQGVGYNRVKCTSRPSGPDTSIYFQQ